MPATTGVVFEWILKGPPTAIIPVALVAVRINHNESVCVGKSVERSSRTPAKLLSSLARAVECN